MEEREALKKQIELLQNLINKHKSIHGNVPAVRGGATSTTVVRGGASSTPVVRGGASSTPVVRGGASSTPVVRGGARTTPVERGGASNTPVERGGASSTPVVRGGASSTPVERGGASTIPVERDGASSTPVVRGGASSTPVERGGASSTPVERGGASSTPVVRGGASSTPVERGGASSTPVERGGASSTPVGRGGASSAPAVRGGAYSTPAARGGAYSAPAARGGAYSAPVARGGAYSAPAARGGAYSAPAARGGAYSAPAARGGAYSAPAARGGAYSAPVVCPAAPGNQRSWRKTYSLRNKNSTPSSAGASVESGNTFPGEQRVMVSSSTHVRHNSELTSTTSVAAENPPPTLKPSQSLTGLSAVKRSQFTWVKTVSPAPPNQCPTPFTPVHKPPAPCPPLHKTPPSVTSVKKTEASVGSAHLKKATPPASPVPLNKVTPCLSPTSLKKGASPLKKTPLPRRTPRRQSSVATSRYRWVSFSSATGNKAVKKTISTKTPPPVSTKTPPLVYKGGGARKLRNSPSLSSKLKRAIPAPGCSRYRWKAGGQGSSTASVIGQRSSFHWSSDKSTRALKSRPLGSPPPQQAPPSTSTPTMLSGFKLRSRMKIIRTSSSSGSGPDRGVGPSPGKAALRVRAQTWTRRTLPRDLVSIGRHKLRRVSTRTSRTGGTSPGHRSPASQRVFRSRYKMVTRTGSHAIQFNPALIWRTKRIHTARTFLQSRLQSRSPHMTPQTPQRWRSNMCWIGGSLYRVSANKLSRTTPSSTPTVRMGRYLGSTHSSPVTLNRPSSSRHLASRAVQRSLAIIRHARHRKQPRQFCMYYNRFGRCNRGNNCPYIHDPDKVAVCTRFLRGTCKQADGTCPFSHKVAKEKMPVCSYFLKGLCTNSECPYSHVYVSHKAEVCEDFVRGYCPDGQKCKKKHTLMCPDFTKTGSCPRGARCKLQHRHPTKRSTCPVPNAGVPPKRTRTKETNKRSRASAVSPLVLQTDPQTPPAGHLPLPSFISLCSSPEDADTPNAEQSQEVKGKSLQIKPRL